MSVADVRAFCAGALPAWKVPREIVVVDALPQDARGKVSRRELERLVTQARGGQVAAGGAAVDRRV
jgi:acyl-CoA synthetase (AMP-forming)/AMP-acid ligase II